MSLKVAEHIRDLIGKTPMIRVPSLSKITGCEIFLKCENMNPGQSIKDRAAFGMVKDAIESGSLKPGMTIVEGTAGNTGIGLALVGKSLGYNMIAVMPNDQAKEKVQQLQMNGAEVIQVDPVPFSNENHFYHTAARMAREKPDQYWHANQFENLSNMKAHMTSTAPEIFEQMNGKIDFLVSVAGTGGTIAGNSKFLKEKIPSIKVILIDPNGSGLYNYIKKGSVEATPGKSITEGIGIMRLVANFKQAIVDDAYSIPDSELITVAKYLKDHDSISLGSSSALNVTGALKVALKYGPGHRIVTFWCDNGDRSASKLYNPSFLETRDLGNDKIPTMEQIIEKYKKE